MEFNNCNSNACCTKLIAFNTKIPLFDLSHILHTLTFIDFFWNNHHFQKPEENLRSACVRLGITQKSVVMIEGWCACPDGLAGSFCLVFNNLPRWLSPVVEEGQAEILHQSHCRVEPGRLHGTRQCPWLWQRSSRCHAVTSACHQEPSQGFAT